MNIAGWILSIMGYLVGFYFALLFKQSDDDALAIAVESNIPNEGNCRCFLFYVFMFYDNNNNLIFCVFQHLDQLYYP